MCLVKKNWGQKSLRRLGPRVPAPTLAPIFFLWLSPVYYTESAYLLQRHGNASILLELWRYRSHICCVELAIVCSCLLPSMFFSIADMVDGWLLIHFCVICHKCISSCLRSTCCCLEPQGQRNPKVLYMSPSPLWSISSGYCWYQLKHTKFTVLPNLLGTSFSTSSHFHIHSLLTLWKSEC